MRYGTLDPQGRPVYFTGTIYINGNPVANPTLEMYLAQGQKPFLDAKPPTAKSGTHYVRAGWTEQAKAIVPKWRLVADIPPHPRTFSKLKIVSALMEANVWRQVKAYIEREGLYDLYLAAQEFAEDRIVHGSPDHLVRLGILRLELSVSFEQFRMDLNEPAERAFQCCVDI